MPIATLTYAENAAFSIQRSLPAYEVSRSDLISFARRIITEATEEAVDAEEIDPDAWENHNRRKLDTAARVIVSLASRSESSPEVRAELLALATIAFGLDGNHVSAALIGRAALRMDGLPERLVVTIGIACPTLALECMKGRPLSGMAEEILQASHARAALPLGDVNEVVSIAIRYRNSDQGPGLGYFFDLALSSLEVVERLRFDSVLSHATFPLKPIVLARLLGAGRLLALPSQSLALSTPELLGSDRPALVSLPTGAGKTLVGLLVLAASLKQRNDVAVFLAPYLAIRRQVIEAASSLFGDSVVIEAGSGGGLTSDLPVLIVDTPEGFDRRLRQSPDLLKRVRAVVYDEAQVLGSDKRGMTSDGLLTRLAMATGTAPGARVVLLSAVLEDDEPVLAWLGQWGAPIAVRSRWQPAARRLGVWHQSGELAWVRTVIGGDGKHRVHPVVSTRIEPVHSVLSPGSPKGSSQVRVKECDENVALLAHSLWKADGLVTLAIVNSRARARSLARAIGARLPVREATGERVMQLSGTIRAEFKEFLDLVPLMRKGVAYHSALLPPKLRAGIELACAYGELEFVCATTSLAEGADLPFGRTILADWTWSYGDGQHEPFAPALWRNIAGRCGRPSSHIEGETIFVEDTPPVAFWPGPARALALQEVLTGAVALGSALDDDIERGDLVRQQATSQALAVIQENPSLEEAHIAFSQRLLSRRIGPLGSGARLDAYLETRLLDGDSPVARRNSPLKLTERGLLLYKASVLPDTTEALVGLLRSGFTPSSEAELCKAVLTASSAAAELSTTRLPKLLEKGTVRGLWVRASQLQDLCASWLSGHSTGQMLLECAISGERANAAELAHLAAWLEGEEESEKWVSYYDKLQEFVNGVFGEFLPRGLATVKTVRDTIPSPDWDVDMDALIAKARTAGRGADEGSSQLPTI